MSPNAVDQLTHNEQETSKEMIKNFSARALGINGRQSELIELALTYAFDGIDIDMEDLFRRSQRTDAEDATKYLSSAAKAYEKKNKPLEWGMFEIDVNLDDDEDSFKARVAGLHPVAEFAHDVGLTRAIASIPVATDRLPYHEYFEAQKNRVEQIAEILAAKEISFGLSMTAGKELGEGKQFEFIRNVEGFRAFVDSCSSAVGYVIDTWDWIIGEGAMDQLTEIPVEKIVAVRLSSVPEDVDVSKAESTEKGLPTGEGMFNHVNLIKHLASIEYVGPVGPGASAARYKGQTREAIVKAAQEAIDGIFTEAGLEVAPLPMDLIEDIPYEASTSIT